VEGPALAFPSVLTQTLKPDILSVIYGPTKSRALIQNRVFPQPVKAAARIRKFPEMKISGRLVEFRSGRSAVAPPIAPRVFARCHVAPGSCPPYSFISSHERAPTESENVSFIVYGFS